MPPSGKLILLAPATKHITPVSTRAASSNNKKIAMEPLGVEAFRMGLRC